jgi:hypothetical protein
MNGMNAFETTTRPAQDTSNYLLKMALDAMLDTLTVEQQAKMTSYLLRTHRQGTEAQPVHTERAA